MLCTVHLVIYDRIKGHASLQTIEMKNNEMETMLHKRGAVVQNCKIVANNWQKHLICQLVVKSPINTTPMHWAKKPLSTR